jgi:predicted alternative tryptophan synthase beta-subunit
MLTRWYNGIFDFPKGLQLPLVPEMHEPMGPEKLSAVFSMASLKPEMSQEQFIEIPRAYINIDKIYEKLSGGQTAQLHLSSGADRYLSGSSVGNWLNCCS